MWTLLAICLVITNVTSAIGVYEIIRRWWERAEVSELGVAVVTRADTVVAIIMTFVIVSVLFLAELYLINEM